MQQCACGLRVKCCNSGCCTLDVVCCTVQFGVYTVWRTWVHSLEVCCLSIYKLLAVG